VAGRTRGKLPAERDDVDDGAVLDAEHVEGHREVGRVFWALDVVGHCRLPVGAGDQAAQQAERVGAESAVDPALHTAVAALPHARLGRHREPDVLVQDVCEAARVRPLGEFDDAVEHLAFGGGGVAVGAPLEPPFRKVGADPGPRALRGAVDGRDGRLEQFRGLLGRAAEDVAQDQHSARQRREVLDRHEERELDRLLLDDRGMRVVLGGRQLLQQLVGIGLQSR
jgi:hypothetical protein